MERELFLAELPEPTLDDWQIHIQRLDVEAAVSRLEPLAQEAVWIYAETQSVAKVARVLRIKRSEAEPLIMDALARLREWLG